MLLGGRRRIKVDKGMELRLLSALELLEAGREAEQLACREEEKALCANACLLARALERDRKPAFPDGEAVLKGLSAGEIGEHFPVTAASISRHLSVLKEADLIRDTREGKYIYYELNASVLEEIMLWISDLKGASEHEGNDHEK